MKIFLKLFKTLDLNLYFDYEDENLIINILNNSGNREWNFISVTSDRTYFQHNKENSSICRFILLRWNFNMLLSSSVFLIKFTLC